MSKSLHQNALAVHSPSGHDSQLNGLRPRTARKARSVSTAQQPTPVLLLGGRRLHKSEGAHGRRPRSWTATGRKRAESPRRRHCALSCAFLKHRRQLAGEFVWMRICLPSRASGRAASTQRFTAAESSASDQWVRDFEGWEGREVAVSRPQFTNPVTETQRRDSRIVHTRTD